MSSCNALYQFPPQAGQTISLRFRKHRQDAVFRIALPILFSDLSISHLLLDWFEAFLAAHVGAKNLGNRHRAVGVEVLLEERYDEARQSDTRAVQRVDELRLAVGILEAAVEAPRLVVGEAAAGADFKPLLFARSPKFEVIALRG